MATKTSYEKVLDALSDRIVKVRGDNALARCPLPGHSNGDEHPGLSITSSDGELLVYCHGQHGACYVDLLELLNIDAPKRDKITNDRPEMVDLYSYKDIDGETLYQVARFHPKTFRQRQPNGKGGWIHNLDGVARVPYHLEQMLEAIEEGQTILFVEGEKDVRNAEAYGFVATTIAQGANSWKAGAYTEWFKGADVVIIPDNDGVGERHAFEVARDVVKVTNEVRIVRLPVESKGDLYDYLLVNTPDDLEKLIVDSKVFDPDRDRLDQSLTITNALEQECIVDTIDDGLTFTWAEDGVVITTTSLRSERSGIFGVIDIEYGIHGKVVRRQRVNLESSSQRESLRTRMNQVEKDTGKDRKWMDYIGFAAGSSIDYISSSGGWTSLAEIAKPEPATDAWICKPMWQGRAGQPHVTLIVAHGETGKSYLAQANALSIASGKMVLGFNEPGVVGPVLVLDFESEQDTWVERLHMLADGARIDLNELGGRFMYERITGGSLEDVARDQAARIREHGVVAVIIDAAGGAIRGSLNDAEAVNGLYRACQVLGVPVLLVHHTNREDSYFGSVYFHDRARLRWETVSSSTLKDDRDTVTEKVVVWEVRKTSNVPRSTFGNGRIAFKYTWDHKLQETHITPMDPKHAQFIAEAADKGGEFEFGRTDRIKFTLMMLENWADLDTIMDSGGFDDRDRANVRNTMNQKDWIERKNEGLVTEYRMKREAT